MIWAPLGDRPPWQVCSGIVPKASMRVVPTVPRTRAMSILGCSDCPLVTLIAGGDRPLTSPGAGLARCAPYECHRVRPMARGVDAYGGDRPRMPPVAGGGKCGLRVFWDRPQVTLAAGEGNRSPASGFHMFWNRPIVSPMAGGENRSPASARMIVHTTCDSACKPKRKYPQIATTLNNSLEIPKGDALHSK